MQPLTPWWLHIDCDGTYLGSALNLYAGKPTEYFDHPGMPLQALLTFALALDHAVLRLSVNISRTEYVDRILMDPGSVLWLIRGLAIGFFLLALATAHEVGRRWSGRRMGGVFAA